MQDLFQLSPVFSLREHAYLVVSVIVLGAMVLTADSAQSRYRALSSSIPEG